MESLAKQIPIEDPYQWDLAKEYDAITMETFVHKNARTQAVRDTIQAACRSVIGISFVNKLQEIVICKEISIMFATYISLLSLGADLDRVSALFFLAYANSAGGVMKLLMATEKGAQELRVKVREKGNFTILSRLLNFRLWSIHREALNKLVKF